MRTPITIERFFFWLLLIVILGFSIYNAVDFYNEILREKRILKANQDLRKINLTMLGLFRRKLPLDRNSVWKAVGDAVTKQDPWGHEYQMEGEGRLTRWQSAGPDGQWGTRDDIHLSLAKVSKDFPRDGSVNSTENEEDNLDAISAK